MIEECEEVERDKCRFGLKKVLIFILWVGERENCVLFWKLSGCVLGWKFEIGTKKLRNGTKKKMKE